MLILTSTYFYSIGEEDAGGLNQPEAGEENNHLSKASTTWTLIIYMAGDNNMGSNSSSGGNALWADMNELERAYEGITNANIIVLADELGAGNTRIYEVHYDDITALSSPTIPLSTVNSTWADELNTGDPKILEEFSIWAINNYPADHYLLELWNHGSGCFGRSDPRDGTDTRYICTDNDGGRLNMGEMRSALETITVTTGITLDVFSMDACSMAMIEVFYQVYPYADLCLASEEEVPWYGLDYTYIEKFVSDPEVTPEELVTYAVEYFYTAYNDGQPDPGDQNYATFSAVNLASLNTVINTSFKAFLDELIPRTYFYSKDGNGKLPGIRANTQSYRASSHVDLLHFVELVRDEGLGPSITNAASQLYEQLNETVVISVPGKVNPDSRGISVYFEKFDHSYRINYDGDVSELIFTQETEWDEFLNLYLWPVKPVDISYTLESLDGDEVYDDITIVFKENDGTAIDAAEVIKGGIQMGVTDSLGRYIEKDLNAGDHSFELKKGDLIGIVDVNVVNKPPTAEFIISHNSAFEDEFVTFNASLSSDPENDPLDYSWDFDLDDGLQLTDSNGMEVQWAFPNKGEYTVTLQVSDSAEVSMFQKKITINNRPPVAWVEEDHIETLEDALVLLNASGSTDTPSDLNALEFMWVYGDGESSNWTAEPIIAHAFGRSGEFDSVLYVKDDNEDISFLNVSVKVSNVAPVARFAIEDTGFTDTSTGVELFENIEYSLDPSLSIDTTSDIPTLLFFWSYTCLENNTYSTTYFGSAPEPSFQYKGEWSIKLTVRDNDGASNSTELTVLIKNSPPRAVAPGNGTIFCYEDLLVNFDGSNSTDSEQDEGMLRYLWDLDGDGTYESTGKQLSTAYRTSGEINASLKVYDELDQFDITSFKIIVQNKAPVIVSEGLYEIFEDEVLILGTELVEDSMSDREIMKMQWDLDGDGIFDNSSQSIQVSMSEEGTYNITLRATDDEGEKDTSTFTVRILNKAPEAKFSSEILDLNDLRVRFDGGASTDSPSDIDTLVYHWDFGDGGTSDKRSPEHRYSSSGEYNITLTVTDDNGAVSTYSAIVVLDVEDTSVNLWYVIIIGIIILSGIGIFLLYRKEKNMEKELIEKERKELSEKRLPKKKKPSKKKEGEQ